MWVFNAATDSWQSLGGGDVSGGDHGSLNGLGDDDHLQYHTDARGDARYALIGHDHDYPNDPYYLRPENILPGANISITDHKNGTVTITASGGGGGTGGVDEVSVSTNAPVTPGTELWIDTDDTATFQTIRNPLALPDHGTLPGLGDDDHPQYVLDTGDTMTGGLTLTGAIGLTHQPAAGIAQITSESVNADAYFDTRAPASKRQGLIMRTGATTRWLVGTDGSAETGNHQGTNFAIIRYADNGTPLGVALSISRVTGQVSVAANPVGPLGVATKQYVDAKVVNSMVGPNEATNAPSQAAARAYVDSKMVVSDAPASGTYPVNTVWIEY